MTKTVIINRPLSDSELIEVKRLAETGSTIFAFSGTDTPDFAQRINLSPEEKRQVNFEIMEEVLRFGDHTVGNQTLADSFRIDTASVWHYHKFRIYFDVCILMYFLYPIQRKFSSFDGHIWFIPQEVKPLQAVFPEVDFRFQEKKNDTAYHFADVFSYLCLSAYRVLRQWLYPLKKKDYLLYLTERYIRVLHPKTLTPFSEMIF